VLNDTSLNEETIVDGLGFVKGESAERGFLNEQIGLAVLAYNLVLATMPSHPQRVPYTIRHQNAG